MHPFPFCFGALGGMPGLKCPWTGWKRVGGAPQRKSCGLLGLCQGCCCSLGSRSQPSPPPHSPTIVDQQPRSDEETEEFPFGWDPDERPLPVSDTLCYPKGLMFLPLQTWGGAQVAVPGHVPSELGGQHACWSGLQAL